MRMLRRGGAPMMMGGRPMHHMSGFKPRPHILRMPFDLFVSESFYPRLKPQPDDKDLTQALLKRHAELVPPTHEQTSIQSLLLKVQGILEGLTVAPGSFEACVSFLYLYSETFWLILLCCKAIRRSEDCWIFQKRDYGSWAQCG